jgi:hypothetical protein
MTDTCERCKKQTDDCEYVTVQTCRQTHSSPAEYESVSVCQACIEYDEYLSDPFNAAYEAARASGWSD